MSSVGAELVRACTSGDVQTLYQLLSQQGDAASLVNLASEGGVTLLMHTIIGAGTADAAYSGRYVECCGLLVQGGADLETADTTYGRTAAHWAVYYHRSDILTVLIEAGSDMTCPDFSGTSPFHLCLQEAATECLTFSLQLLPPEILDVPHPQFLLPLLHAVQLGNREACQLLVTAGADVNQVDPESGRGPLHFATELNHRDLVDFLISCGGHLDVADARGLTPLHIASIIEGAESLEAIVRRVGGEDVLDIRDGQELTPLMHACLYGNIASVKLLLKKKADASLQDSEGRTCLHYAASSATQTALECVQQILKRHKSLLDVKDNLERTPLHLCAMSGTVETLEFLLSLGCSLDTLDASQRTLVHWAAVNGNHTVLSKLLELEVPVDPIDTLGSTPLLYACQQAAEPTDAAYSEEAFVRAQLAQECVGMLLRGGASVELRDPQGYLPLHSALILPNNLRACQLLLESGADPEAKTELEGWTSLHLAARRGIVESCQLLLEHTGGRLGTVLDQEGASALHHAVGSGSVDCLEYLLQAGLSPNHTNAEQRTPSHLAAGAGLTACLQVLQGYGANLGAADAEGATPLHEAAANGHTDAVDFLLSSESVKINKGVEQTHATPLHYAVQGGHEECVQLLIDYGAKVNVLTLVEEEQLSPLDLCEDQDSPLYQLLCHHGALPGSDVIKHKQDIETTDEHDMGGVEEAESLSVPSVRPTTPSRRSFAASPVFDTLHPDYGTTSHPPSRPVSPITPPAPPINLKEQEPGIFRRVFGGRKSRRVAGGKETMLSSVVGLYATQVTMLAAAVLGSPLGDKVKEMAEKVASTTSEELKKTVITCEGGTPDLTWLHAEEPDAPPTPPHEPTPPPPTPPPPTPPPPIPKVTEDPYERRLRKAKAQLDMSKSPELLAVEELLKAQDTHMKLKRQFQEAQLKEAIAKRQEDFQAEEHKAKKASEKVMQRLEKQMAKAKLVSDVMNTEMEKQLAQARQENDKLSNVMGALGVCPRPTVAQWLQRKQMERKTKLQDSLISWDRGRRRREAAILVEQAVVSQRAMKHAAWGAKKDIQSKIKKIKRSPYKAVTRVVHPKEVLPATPTQRPPSKGNARKSPGKQNKVQPLQPALSTPGAPGRSTTSPSAAAASTVLATPTGFKKVRGEATPKTQPTLSSERDPTLWKIGEDYVVKDKLRVPLFPAPPTDTYLRATGPKTVHAQRTLHFLSPQEYKAAKAADRAMRKQLNQQYGESVAEQPKPRPPVKSRIVIQAIKFDEKSSEKKGVSFTASPPHSSRYHAHMDVLRGGHATESAEARTNDKNLSIFPMNVLESTNLPSVQAS